MVEEREELGGSATMMDNTAQTTDANTQLTKRRLVVPYVKQDHGILRGTIACQSGVCSETSACCYSLHVFPEMITVQRLDADVCRIPDCFITNVTKCWQRKACV